MKKLLFIMSLVLFTMVSCKNNDNHHNEMNHDGEHHDSIMTDETQKTKMNDETAMYSCPMKCEKDKVYHEAGTCPECGMDLTLMNETE